MTGEEAARALKGERETMSDARWWMWGTHYHAFLAIQMPIDP
jgi:hypothetical protein